MPRQPMTKEQLENHFSSFVEYHSSPSRKKFEYEFGIPSPRKKQAPPMPVLPSGRVPETTNQLCYRGYDAIPAFAPETKHRVMKAQDHEFIEQMFLLWNVHGKKGSGLL